jgi:hypothetical protein
MESSMITLGRTFAAAAIALSLATPALAQPGPDGPGWGPGMMMGPGMMGRGMMGRGMCSPRVAGFAEWRIDRMERAISPNDAQKAALAELRTASTKAAEALSGACPQDYPKTASERLERMEKRMEAMLQAVKTVRPAFDALYKTLDDKQKERLDSVGPRRWGWERWR